MRITLINLFIFLSITLLANDKFVLKPKTLNKDIKKQFGIIDYQMNQLDIDSSIYAKGSFYKLQADDSLIGYLYSGRVNSCRAGGCAIRHESIEEGNFEYFDYYIIFNTDKTITKVRVFNYQATHGQEVSSQAWLKQFRGYQANERLQVGKDIDAISGATISVYAITSDIEYVSKLITKI